MVTPMLVYLDHGRLNGESVASESESSLSKTATLKLKPSLRHTFETDDLFNQSKCAG